MLITPADVGRYYRTRDGRIALITEFRWPTIQPVNASIAQPDGTLLETCFGKDGTYYLNNRPTPLDLVSRIGDETPMEHKPGIDWTKPLQTRRGNPVRMICRNLKGRQPVVIAIADENGNEQVTTCGEDGSFYFGQRTENDYDIVNVPEVKRRIVQKMWANIYKDPTVRTFCYNSLEEAKRQAGSGRFACIEFNVDATEGHGL